MKKSKLTMLIVFLCIPLASGGLSALLSGSFKDTYAGLKQPPPAVPAWLFPVIWTILYILMGLSAWLVWLCSYSSTSFRQTMGPFWIQLFLNFFWSILFFRWHLLYFSSFWLIALILCVWWMIRSFLPVSRKAAQLQIPCLIWCCFAAYLSFGTAILN